MAVFPVNVTYTGSLGAGMNATIVENLGSDRGAQLAFNDGIGFPEWTDVQRYRVAGPPTSYDAIEALSAAFLGYGSPHPYIPGIACYLLKLEASTHEGYLMQAAFKRPPKGAFPESAVLPPTLQVGFTAIEIPAEVDAYGNVVVNSAGDPFDPPQNLTIYAVRMQIVMWKTAYDLATARQMMGKVNHAQVDFATPGNIPARCCKLLNWAPTTPIYLAGVLFPLFPVVVDLEYRQAISGFDDDPGGYDRLLIDQGYQAYYRTGSGSGFELRKGKIAMKDLTQPAKPVLLDGGGAPLGTLPPDPDNPPPYTIIDHPDGFSSFVDNTGASGQSSLDLPWEPDESTDTDFYLTPIQGVGGATKPFYLPYRIEREADFQPLVDAGI